jgi:hypothetical protein
MNMESFCVSNTHTSFNLLFVYLMTENVEWIHKNSHEEVDFRPPPNELPPRRKSCKVF